MSIREFRFILPSQNHEATVAFYRDGLGLPVPESSEQGPGTLFRAGPAMIEVTTPFSPDDPASELASSGSPQGVTIAIEVERVDEWYEQIKAKRLPIKKALSDFPWGHRAFSITDPNGVVVVIFSPIKSKK